MRLIDANWRNEGRTYREVSGTINGLGTRSRILYSRRTMGNA